MNDRLHWMHTHTPNITQRTFKREQQVTWNIGAAADAVAATAVNTCAHMPGQARPGQRVRTVTIFVGS